MAGIETMTVVLPITAPWPSAARALESILRSGAAVGAEIIAVDGTGRGLQGETPGVRWLHRARPDPFALRAHGLAAATGDVVAITEDHCEVATDWCERLLVTHREHPETSVLIGPVANGSAERLVHRAQFLATHGHLLSPLNVATVSTIPVSNFSCKHARLVAMPESGWLEQSFMPGAIARGDVGIADAMVTHIQPLGILSAWRVEFHNGRATAGLATRGEPWRTRRRHVATCARLPIRAWRCLRAAVDRGAVARREFRVCAPFVMTIWTAAALGQLAGVLVGPGRSPEHVRS